MHQTQWLPGVIVLLGGLLAGVFFVLMSRRGKGAAPTGLADESAELTELDRRYQTLLRQLKELGADRHHFTPEAFDAERKRLEHQAAALLRARDDRTRTRKHEEEKAKVRAERAGQHAKAAAATLLGRNPQLTGALWGAGLVGFFGLIGWSLSREASTRTDGQTLTGGAPNMVGGAGAQQAPSEEDQQLGAAMARLRAMPDDVDTLAYVSHELIRREDFAQADQMAGRALGVDPYHVETRIHRAVLRAVRGEGPRAMEELDHLAETFPEAYEALLYGGALAMQLGQPQRALERFERYAREAPAADQPPMLNKSIELLRQQLASGSQPR
jgi:tetratricopeptide (TPR) repeat protein